MYQIKIRFFPQQCNYYIHDDQHLGTSFFFPSITVKFHDQHTSSQQTHPFIHKFLFNSLQLHILSPLSLFIHKWPVKLSYAHTLNIICLLLCATVYLLHMFILNWHSGLFCTSAERTVCQDAIYGTFHKIIPWSYRIHRSVCCDQVLLLHCNKQLQTLSLIEDPTVLKNV